MRVLISGISGFVGEHLARALLADGAEVWGFADELRRPLAGVETRVADLLDHRALVRLAREARPEALVHLAGLSHVGASFDRPDDYRRINVDGTRALLEAVADAAPKARMVVASSAEIYGIVPEDEQPIPESWPPAPCSPYAESKVAVERLARRVGAVVIRPFNIIGPGQAPTFALPSFAAQLARIRAGEQEPVLRVGDLGPRRDFIHVADAVAGYRTLLERGEAGTAYNLARGEATSMREMLERLMVIAEVRAETRVDPGKCRPAGRDAPVMCGDSGRLRALGWTPRHTLDDALGDLWRHTLRGHESRSGAAS